MPGAQGKIVEGVFAINKPPSISSAQVIRNLQHVFNPSALFAPWLRAERDFRREESRRHGNRRKDRRVQVKIGHGGTLDPMATGVLIMGIGSGTKRLQDFLECTKSYEATILFGAATDTYDVLGKVLRRAPYRYVTREKVEEVLNKFRGKILQRPPIYSALRMEGKRLYEYAREGKEVPREIEKRPVEVKQLEIMEWHDGGAHSYRLPQEEAEDEAKAVAEKVLHLRDVASSPTKDNQGDLSISDRFVVTKRKRSLEDEDEMPVISKRPALQRQDSNSDIFMSGGLQSLSDEEKRPSFSSEQDCQALTSSREPLIDSPPAVRLRMTVTSGFYVRSLSHDLGEAVGSLACMSELVRTRQGDFELGKNVLSYDDLHKGETVWGPKVESFLDTWEAKRTDIHKMNRNQGADQ